MLRDTAQLLGVLLSGNGSLVGCKDRTGAPAVEKPFGARVCSLFKGDSEPAFPCRRERRFLFKAGGLRVQGRG